MSKKIGSIEVGRKDLEEALYGNADGGFYTGSGDKMIDFGKAQNFTDEKDSGKVFGIKFVNNSQTKTIKVQFNKLISGIINGCSLLEEGTVDTDLKVIGNPNSASFLAAYLEKHPTRIREIKIKVDDADQLDEPVKLVSVNLFGSEDVQTRIPSDVQDGSTNNILSATLDNITDWVCSDKTTLVMGIRPGRKVNVSITFGASVDTEKYLTASAAAARQTVAGILVQKANEAK